MMDADACRYSRPAQPTGPRKAEHPPRDVIRSVELYRGLGNSQCTLGNLIALNDGAQQSKRQLR
jgi:hypothetical protein